MLLLPSLCATTVTDHAAYARAWHNHVRRDLARAAAWERRNGVTLATGPTIALGDGLRRNVVVCSVVNDDLRNFCRDYTGEKFHALLCDPPYHLTSITKRFGADGAAPAKPMKSGDKAFSRLSKGFMGKTWDGGDVAFDPATWEVLGEHLHDGAFGMAFASSRGWHRLAVAIEDAGFIIHPSIFGWGFGSGFPKATRVHDDQFEGHRYGLQALKPALEPIIVFQKPYTGKPRDCITSSGAGALWIDGTRIPTNGEQLSVGFADSKRRGVNNIHEGWARPWQADGEYYGSKIDAAISESNEKGRWPANLALIHDARCNGSCVPECAVRRLGEQSGYKEPFGSISGNEPSHPSKTVYNGYGRQSWQAYEDEGTAARFFHNADWQHEVAERIAAADPVRYVAKASSDERSRGLDDFPLQDKWMGHANQINESGEPAEQIKSANSHPTVKPIALTEWLARLLLPPAGYAPRRLLVPFAGSGSEMIGAYLAGWEHVVGIELDSEYSEIARARLTYYTDPLRKMFETPAAAVASPTQRALPFADAVATEAT